MTACSDVPPPMFTIMLPDIAFTGMPAPSAARIGSRTMKAWPAPRFARRVHHRATFGLRDAGRNGNDDVRFHDVEPPRRLRDEIREHCFRDVVIRDDAVFERAVRDDLVRRAADHFLRLGADREHGVVRTRERDDRRLIDDESLARHKNDGVRRPQINSDFLVEHTPY